MPLPAPHRYRGGESSGFHQNPINVRTNWRSFVISHFGLVGWIGTCLILALIYLILFSPWLSISTIQISGTNNEQAYEIYTDTIRELIQKHRWGLVPQSNLFAFDEKAVEQKIKDTYAFSEVQLDAKLFKRTVLITVVETPPSAIWYSQNAYYFLNDQGVITHTIGDVIQEGSGFAQIIDDASEAVAAGVAVLTPEKMRFIATVHATLVDIPALPVFNYSLAQRLSTQLKIHITDQPYVIFMDTSTSVDIQLEKLRRIASEGLIAEKDPREYIDLRIGDRVYFK